MRKHIKLSALCGFYLSILLFAFALFAQEKTPSQQPSTNSELIARSLKDYVSRNTNLEIFGKEIEREILLAATKKIRDGQLDDITVNLEFKVNVRPILSRAKLPLAPVSGEIDICWEICPNGRESFLECYVDCNAPDLPEPTIPSIVTVRDCDDIWRDYRQELNRIVRLRYLIELYANGCMQLQPQIISRTDEYLQWILRNHSK